MWWCSKVQVNYHEDTFSGTRIFEFTFPDFLLGYLLGKICHKGIHISHICSLSYVELQGPSGVLEGSLNGGCLGHENWMVSLG